MRLVNTEVQFISPEPELQVYTKLEYCGRKAYKSEERITGESYKPFIRNLLKRGHESVLEHAYCTVSILTDRATANAVVRHRHGSYTQESTIYCDYGKAGDLRIRTPFFLKGMDSPEYKIWRRVMQHIEDAYKALRVLGVSPGMARDVLPCALNTEIVCTFNFRGWRDFLRTRFEGGDSKGMQLLVYKLYNLFMENYPLLFEDLEAPAESMAKIAVEEFQFEQTRKE